MLWTKNSNNTHGFIRATVDFSVGPKPINATGYRARTLNDKRLICIRYFSLFASIFFFFNRRDFRLFIANPNNPKEKMANPVIWFDTELVIEVKKNFLLRIISITNKFIVTNKYNNCLFNDN